MSRFAILTFFWLATVAGITVLFPVQYCFWVIALATLIYFVILGLGVAFIQLQFFLPAFCHGSRRAKQVALTFDDGPDRTSTPMLLKLLARHSIKATFFCVGQKVLSEPELMRRIVAEGHQVGSHSYKHSWWTNFLTSHSVSNEIRLAQTAIQDAIGVTPVIYRPPIGLTNPLLGKALQSSGLTCVGWDVRSLDKTSRNTANVLRRVLKKTTNGSVILLHDGGANPEKMLAIASDVIANLRQQGYNFTRIDNMMGDVCEPFN